MVQSFKIIAEINYDNLASWEATHNTILLRHPPAPASSRVGFHQASPEINIYSKAEYTNTQQGLPV